MLTVVSLCCGPGDLLYGLSLLKMLQIPNSKNKLLFNINNVNKNFKNVIIVPQSLLCFGIISKNKAECFYISTSISLKMSRGPITSASYLTCALLVAKATEAYITPFSFTSVDSILWTQEAHVIPLTWETVEKPDRKRGGTRDYPVNNNTAGWKCCIKATSVEIKLSSLWLTHHQFEVSVGAFIVLHHRGGEAQLPHTLCYLQWIYDFGVVADLCFTSHESHQDGVDPWKKIQGFLCSIHHHTTDTDEQMRSPFLIYTPASFLRFRSMFDTHEEHVIPPIWM